MQNKELCIENSVLQKGVMVLNALNHPLRQDMLLLIHKQELITVTEIYKYLNIEQSLTSQHLSVLRKAGFVNTRKAGSHILYSVNHDKVNEVQQKLKELIAL
jgi:DNA-binding transcriptional ArsR family regulator